MYYTCFFKPTQPFSTESVKYFAFFNPFYVQNFIRIHLHFSFYSQHRLTINIKILWFPGLRPKITAADLKKYRGEGTYCAMEMRLKNCGSLCWHNFRSQRLIGMPCTMDFTPILFLNPPHNLPLADRLSPQSSGWLLLDLYTLYTISLNSSMMYIRQMQILVQAQICTWLIVYTKKDLFVA